MAEIGADFRGGYYGEQVEPSGGGYDPLAANPNGPLASLFANGYDFSSRFYPRNLASETRGHYINFYINVAERSQYLSEGKYTLAGGAGRTATNQANQAQVLGNAAGGALGNLSKELGVPAKAGNTVGNVSSAGLSAVQSLLTTRKTKRITQAIALYMPETVNVQYNADWQSLELTAALGTAGKIAQQGTSAADSIQKSINSFKGGDTMGAVRTLASNPAVAEAVGDALTATGAVGSDASSFFLYATGNALNPQLQVLFKGTDFRQFQFDFLFAPFSPEEAQNVMEIIKTFKFHQAPEVNSSGMGRYFIPPSEFDIDFLLNGQINTKVHQIGTCVLSNMNVDYAPNGWSTFGDGTPTHIRLTLQFMETEIVTKERVDKDNY
jgi:hypothetical protein